MIKILADENITYAQKAFAAFGEVSLRAGRSITTEDLRDKDILLVRSVTQVNQALLENTPVRFVGTATIGIDHIDLDYLSAQNIQFASCQGCNANAVAEYVITALLSQASLQYWQTKTVAIIGYGNVGKALAAWLEALKINYIINDPPLENAANNKEQAFVDLETALKADVVTLHVPLVKVGQWSTYHLLSKEQLSKIKTNATLINTSRGEVIDNKELLVIARQKNFSLLFDVWEGEPEPLLDLVDFAQIATPHIAGYSVQGKINGTRMLHTALNDFYQKSEPWNSGPENIEKQYGDISRVELESLIKQSYPILDETREFKQIISAVNRAEYFDLFRKNYKLRGELGTKVLQNVIDNV